MKKLIGALMAGCLLSSPAWAGNITDPKAKINVTDIDVDKSGNITRRESQQKEWRVIRIIADRDQGSINRLDKYLSQLISREELGGHDFKVVHALLVNGHLSRIMLVSDYGEAVLIDMNFAGNDCAISLFSKERMDVIPCAGT